MAWGTVGEKSLIPLRRKLVIPTDPWTRLRLIRLDVTTEDGLKFIE